MKIPFNFGFPSLIRLYFPGLFLSILTFPVFSEMVKKIPFLAELSKPDYILLEAIVWGIIIYALDDVIYQVFEGRMLWPDFLFNRGVEKENNYIKKLLNLNETLKKEGKIGSRRYRELWYRLRVFPMDKDSQYTAVYPTRLGNIIRGYEDYPGSRYGIDAVFSWYRIWLKMDKEAKGEIDKVLAKADFAVYSSFVFYLSFIFNIVVFIISYCQCRGIFFLLPLPSCTTLLVIASVSLFSGYLFYRLSCPLHRFYGEYFKALFDLNKNSIMEIGEYFGADEEERKRTMEMIRYLQYHKTRCPGCGKLNPGYPDKCQHCGKEPPPVFKELFT